MFNDEIQTLKQRVDALGITQKQLSKIHNRKPQQIWDAIQENTTQIGLRKRIVKYITNLELRNSREVA